MMKVILFSPLVLLSFFSCTTKTATDEKYPLKSFELGGPIMKDTMNIIDGNNRKQGLWIMPISKDTMVYKNDTGYSTKGYTFREVVKMISKGQLHQFTSYDSLAVKSK